jgi:hypothetical protein
MALAFCIPVEHCDLPLMDLYEVLVVIDDLDQLHLGLDFSDILFVVDISDRTLQRGDPFV